MPVVEVDKGERYPDYYLTRVDEPIGTDYHLRSWVSSFRIETEAEYIDYLRVRTEYNAWIERIDGALMASRRGAEQ